MISFYPGPSRVHDEVPAYVKDAHKLGILSVNHRSDEFMSMCKKTVALLKSKLGIPKNYTVFFTGSATECWEIIAQSLSSGSSCHLHNGAFGQKWFDYTRRLHSAATSMPFDVNEAIDPTKLTHDPHALVCVTQNETSNGTQVTNAVLKSIRRQVGDALIAVDATSSLGGVRLDFKSADVWFASVQKCFGLPAGLGVLICSPAAIQRATTLGEKQHYNSLTFMIEMMEKWQTSFTPNVLGIYLLMRVMEDAPPIADVEKRLIDQYNGWVDFMTKRNSISHFVDNPKVRSYTVVPVKATEEVVQTIKKAAKKNGLLLGEGYGPFKPVTFRIANFPALQAREIKTLKKFLEKY
jgi:phosphoserine aminotransferase